MIELPEPDTAAKAHSQTLSEIIRAEIRKTGGSIGFDRYMELALYRPGLGYYCAGRSKFGALGDFVTAPEVSSLFAQCIARQCDPLLHKLNKGCILELGAGTGAMAADVLEALDHLGNVPKQYFILELSADLRYRQAKTLQARVPHLYKTITWLDFLPSSGFRGVILGNEVLDAMPVQCFSLGKQGVLERRVGVEDDGRFKWRDLPASADLSLKVRGVTEQLSEPLPLGYCSEINPLLGAWMNALAESLAEAVVFLVDYGYSRREYYHPQRTQGTLLCHYQHRAHDDPFFYPGLQDISANVDFTAVAEAGVAAGMELMGYTSQAHFLFANGLDEIFSGVHDDGLRLRYAQQIKQLTLPSEMGERFQVMALSKSFSEPLQGFALRDHRSRL